MRFHHLVAVLIAGICVAGPVAAQDGASAELDAKVDALASEVNRLRESLSVPEDEQKKSYFGLGPAASKVYDNDGLSIGGYGELYMGHFLGVDGFQRGSSITNPAGCRPDRTAWAGGRPISPPPA